MFNFQKQADPSLNENKKIENRNWMSVVNRDNEATLLPATVVKGKESQVGHVYQKAVK